MAYHGSSMTTRITRLAPSPTGALHLGNARTFLLNQLLARAEGWRMLMRVEDLDGPRVKPGATEAMLEQLAWMGLQWEEPIVYQDRRLDRYDQCLRELIDLGAAYPCICSRKDIETAAGAPHAEDFDGVYPGTCRGRFADAEQAQAASDRPIAWRVIVPDEEIVIDDHIHGRRSFNLARTCGDFVIHRSSGRAAYQLAVTVDDADSNVDAVVRADDLLESAARQVLLRRLLGLAPEAEYWHLPLVIGPDGRRLAKRHGDTRLSHYRRQGMPRERLWGLLGTWSGLLDRRREVDLDELQARFDLARVPREPIVFTQEDDDFLLGR